MYIIYSTGTNASTASIGTGIGIGAVFYHRFCKERQDMNATAT